MTMLKALWPLLVLAPVSAVGGCASGNSSSFSQAPLFFSDRVNRDGNPVDTTAEVASADALVSGDFVAGVPSYLTVGGNAILPVNRIQVAAAATTEVGPGALSVGATADVANTSLGVNAALTGAPGAIQPTVNASLGGNTLAVTAPVTLGAEPLAATGNALTTVGSVLGRTPVTPAVGALPSTLIQTTSSTLARTCLLAKC